MITKKLDVLNDQEFITCVCEEYIRLMYYTAQKYVSNPQQCEDIVQDSLLRLMGKVETLRALNEPALASYVVATVRNTSINFLRRQGIEEQKRAETYLRMQEQELEAPSMDELIISREERERLRSIWPQVDSGVRILLEGKYFLGQDDKQLAQLFGCSPASIRMKLTRARRMVLKLMKEGEGIE